MAPTHRPHRSRAPRLPDTPLDHDPEALRWARTQDGRSQKALAAAAGISPGHMCEIEHGTRNAPQRLITKFADILGCPRSVLEAKTSAEAAAHPRRVA